MSTMEKRALISSDNRLTISRQCALLGLQRSSYYYDVKESKHDTVLMNEIWLEFPFYGYRRITDELADRDMITNHKCVLRLMKLMGLRSVLPKPRTNTSIANKEDSVRPYLLKGLTIDHPNQV